jgi:hypothetical protein
MTAGNPVILAFSANSLLTLPLYASDTLAFGMSGGNPSIASSRPLRFGQLAAVELAFGRPVHANS